MRRSDREITDPAKIRDIISRCHCCRLGLSDDGGCYIVPLSFGYEERGEKRLFYFHSAKEGRKLRLIAAAPRVGFELDCGYLLHENDVPCKNSAAFESIIGTGTVHVVTEPEEARNGLLSILRHTSGKSDWTLPRGAEESVCVLRLDVETLTCKVHL